MKVTILSNKGPNPLSSNFVDYMYPVDSMFQACKQFDGSLNLLHKDFSPDGISKESLAGPIKQLPNSLNGKKREQKFLNTLDRVNLKNYINTADRLHWKGRGNIPNQPTKILAPIELSSTLTRSATKRASRAMAVGVFLQYGRSQIWLSIIERKVSEVVSKSQAKHLNAKTFILSVCIKYLKVSREYGKAPDLYSVTMDRALDPIAYQEFNEKVYIDNKVLSMCRPQVVPHAEVSIKGNPNDTVDKERYGYALLFLKCEI